MSNPEIIAGLNPPAADLARAFIVQFPRAVLTSGRRTVEDQAHADAINIVNANDRHWMTRVYKASPALAAVQAALNELTWPTPILRVELAILGALSGLQPSVLRGLSWHLAGDAFDVQPTDDETMSDALAALVTMRIAAGGAGRFLSREGGLIRWHVQVA